MKQDLEEHKRLINSKSFEGKILLIEDSIVHNALLSDQLCRIMGYPKKSIIYATDGE